MSLNKYVRLIYNSLTGVKPVLTEATKAELGLDFLTWLGTRVDGTASVIALGFLSLSQNQSRAGVIDLIEYA